MDEKCRSRTAARAGSACFLAHHLLKTKSFRGAQSIREASDETRPNFQIRFYCTTKLKIKLLSAVKLEIKSDGESKTHHRIRVLLNQHPSGKRAA